MAPGPEEVHAEATPESKLALVESPGAGAVRGGDGINDAAAFGLLGMQGPSSPPPPWV